MMNRMEMHEEFQKQIHAAALREYVGDSWRLGEEPATLSQWMRWSHSSDIGNPVYTNRDVLADMSFSRPFEEGAIAAGNLDEVLTACHVTTQLALDELQAGILDEEAQERLAAERAGEDSRRRESPAHQELDDDLALQIEEARRATGVDCLPSTRTTGEPSAKVAFRELASNEGTQGRCPACGATAFESPEADCPEGPSDDEKASEGEATRDDSPANAAAMPLCSPDGHEWVAFSTALSEGWIMVQCVECGAHGTVDEPTAEEWHEAFHAPSRPYLWKDDARVTLRHLSGPCYVMRATTPET